MQGGAGEAPRQPRFRTWGLGDQNPPLLFSRGALGLEALWSSSSFSCKSLPGPCQRQGRHLTGDIAWDGSLMEPQNRDVGKKLMYFTVAMFSVPIAVLQLCERYLPGECATPGLSTGPDLSFWACLTLQIAGIAQCGGE
jgi:hypothetical protein